MGRKSTVDKLPEAVKKHIEKKLRENNLTLDELIIDLKESFPSSELPSRSALGRKKQGVEEMLKSFRETQAVAEVMVAELGENYDDKSGPLMVQLLTTLTTKAAFGHLEKDTLDTNEVLALARAVKNVQESRTLSFKERQAIAKQAREKLLEEQKEMLAAADKKGGVTIDTRNAIREILGIGI